MSTYKPYKVLEKPIIFIGNPRSGTSVISEIVMRHKDLGFPSQYQNKYPENTNVNYFRQLFDNRIWRIHGQKDQLNKVSPINNYIFKPQEAYPMWDAIVEDHISFSRGFLKDTVPSEASVRFLRKHFAKMVRKQGKRRLTFKITGPSRIEFLSALFPDAQFIRIHRDPVPTVSSLLKVPFWERLGMTQLWWNGAYSEEEIQEAAMHSDDPIWLTAFQIKKVQDVTDYEVKKLGVPTLDIQYSDFIEEPEKIINEILDFCQLSQDQACFDYFKKNKIYNQNKADSDYFNATDLETIYSLWNAPLTV